MSSPTDDSSPPPQEVGGAFIASTATLFPPSVSITFTFAPEWFADAVREAEKTGHCARRREILFAVCAAESGIVEWVRDAVLERNCDDIARLFPPDKTRGVIEKFTTLPKELVRQGRINASLDCGGGEFRAFRQLVQFRDGLVHAAASRPDRPDLHRPVPTKYELDDLPPGWAINVVRVLLRKLYADTGTEAPSWLSDAAG